MAKNTEKDYMKDISESLKKIVSLKLIELQGSGIMVKEENLLNNSQGVKK